MKQIQILKSLFLLAMFSIFASCCSSSDVVNSQTPTQTNSNNEVDVWLTTANQSSKLEKQNLILAFNSQPNIHKTIEIDANQTFQSIDGFGFTLTGGSVEVINQLTTTKKQELLKELFGNSSNSIGISYLRVSIGASDLNSSVFSYNDMPVGQTDVTLSNFSLVNDNALILMLKEILQINPNIKIMAAPWSPPVWMKDNNSSIGGSLLPQYYSVYAQYFVKYIQKMKKNGINIDAVTPQNEPLHPGNNPSLLMLANQQTNFIKNHLGPAFQNAGITTKIVVYDHNCDKPEYPIEVLSDPLANSFIDGSAFHLYAGNVSALSTVHNAFPNKNIYFTEQWTGSNGTFEEDLKWHSKNVIIGTMRNWSRIALEWNLANDANFKPFTPGGCSQCKGAITINSNESYTKNVAYYIIAHASKFVPAGSIRIASNQFENLYTVAFKTLSNKIVLIILNDGNSSEIFNIKINGKWATTSLNANAVATYIL